MPYKRKKLKERVANRPVRLRHGSRFTCRGECGKDLPPHRFKVVLRNRYGRDTVCMDCRAASSRDAARQRVARDPDSVRKRCIVCGLERLGSCFKRHPKTADGLYHQCNDCLYQPGRPELTEAELVERMGLTLLPPAPAEGTLDELASEPIDGEVLPIGAGEDEGTIWG